MSFLEIVHTSSKMSAQMRRTIDNAIAEIHDDNPDASQIDVMLIFCEHEQYRQIAHDAFASGFEIIVRTDDPNLIYPQ